jgi:hypothetical protein
MADERYPDKSKLYTPCADGWGKSALPSALPVKNFPPARPPTISYESYPATFVVPHCQKNLVNGIAINGVQSKKRSAGAC